MLPTALTGAEHEIWENASLGIVVLKKLDTLGKPTEERLIGGRSVHITPLERRYNQELAIDDSLDVFKNGTLRAVRLIDQEEDSAVLMANVNAMSETDMASTFTLGIRAFTAKVAEIKNPIMLRRMLVLAGEIDATIKQVEAIQKRLDDLSPEARNTQLIGGSLGTQAPRTEGALRAVTPR